jgi:hypothetical protein
MSDIAKTLLGAAVRHVQRPEFQGDKKDGAIYFLKVAAAQYQQRGRYDISYQARRLVRRIEIAGTVGAVWKELGMSADSSAFASRTRTPASNTGVTPSVAAALEEHTHGAI